MPKQHHVKSAKKQIWMTGLKVTKYKTDKDGNKQPYTNYDTSRPFVDSEGKESDKLLVDIGESYYWCKYRYQKRKVKKTPFTSDELKYGKYPKPEWNSRIEDFESQKDSCETEDERDALVSDVEEYRDELQERIEQMPEQLQESSINTERVQELDDLISELNDMDFDD